MGSSIPCWSFPKPPPPQPMSFNILLPMFSSEIGTSTLLVEDGIGASRFRSTLAPSDVNAAFTYDSETRIIRSYYSLRLCHHLIPVMYRSFIKLLKRIFHTNIVKDVSLRCSIASLHAMSLAVLLLGPVPWLKYIPSRDSLHILKNTSVFVHVFHIIF